MDTPIILPIVSISFRQKQFKQQRMYCVLSVGAHQNRRSRVARCARPCPEIVNDVPAQTVYKLPRKKRRPLADLGSDAPDGSSLRKSISYTKKRTTVVYWLYVFCPTSVLGGRIIDPPLQRCGHTVQAFWSECPLRGGFTGRHGVLPYTSVGGSVARRVYRRPALQAFGKPLRMQIGQLILHRPNTRYPPFLRA